MTERSMWLRPAAAVVFGSALLHLSGVSVPASTPSVSGPTTHRVPRATTKITLDGALDEPAWATALQIELRYEVQPGENIEPPVRTICFVTYDERRAYFGFRAYDDDPSRIRARYADRDQAWSDDWVGIVLDTFNDQRRAYELFSTPLGVQIDAINDEVGGSYDDSWNAIWDSAGRITDEGFEVEMAIPFNQIRFQRVDGEQTWGFDAIRSYPRTDRHHIGAFPRDRGNNSYLSQTVKLVGMEDVSPGKNLEVIPTLTGSRTDSVASLPDGELERGDVETDLGVSLRWGLTPSMSLNGAYNPDFSQVEADALQLDVNEQFALFFPETRPFFLEGADYFNTDLRLVHTRTIVDPSAAGKLTGKQGTHTWGVFATEDEVTNIIIPGAEGSSGADFDFSNLNSVARYRYDFGLNSTIGAAVTDRRGEGYSNTVISADTVYKMTDADMLRVNLAISDTEYNGEMEQELGLEPGRGAIRDDAATVEYLHTVRNWWVNVDYGDFGDDYRSDVGFRPRVGYQSLRASGARIWWGEDGDFFHRWAWGGAVFHSEQQSGELLDEGVQSWINFQAAKESFFSAEASTSQRVFSGEEFDVWDIGLSFDMQATADLSVGIYANFGDWIDFAHAQPAEQTYLRPSILYKFGRHLSVRYSHIYSTLDVEGGELFRIHAPELRLIHQFNARAFVRLIVQYTDIESDPVLNPEQDEQTHTVLSQFLFTYKVNPQTAIYVGYTDNQFGTDAFDLTRTDRTFFMKLGYAWVR